MSRCAMLQDLATIQGSRMARNRAIATGVSSKVDSLDQRPSKGMVKRKALPRCIDRLFIDLMHNVFDVCPVNCGM